LYTAVELTYGRVPAITAQNRFPAVKLTTRQQVDAADRKDKTGSRTFGGVPGGSRRRTTFELRTYLTGWTPGTEEPGYGPLFQASLGGAPMSFAGSTVAGDVTGSRISFSQAHGLVLGQAVALGGEIRFVTSIVDSSTVQVNAPFTSGLAAGSTAGPTLTYFPRTELESASVFDYWSPSTAVQRILCGSAVDQMRIQINGDFHEFSFTGVAQDLLDSSSFNSSLGQLDSFPEEPPLEQLDYTIIPGHLGQVWIGVTPEQFFTLTGATITLTNNVESRSREFGSTVPQCLAAGRRSVSVDFSLYERDDAATRALYQAARQQSPVSVMFQLGQQSGQLFGVYLQSVVPDVPEFDDGDVRLEWHFRDARAQGTIDDEIMVAFG